MFIPFESIPDNARIWIYQANRKLTSQEADIISAALLSFTQQWEVHGEPVKASFKIYFEHFIVLAADESYNDVSGCSIDSSVRVLKDLGSHLNIDFFDRSKIAFKVVDAVLLLSLPVLKEKQQSGLWNKDTFVFNNVVSIKGDLENNWIIKAGDTWLKRYLSDAPVGQQQG